MEPLGIAVEAVEAVVVRALLKGRHGRAGAPDTRTGYRALLVFLEKPRFGPQLSRNPAQYA
jgi:hypothetical protein